VVAAFFPEEIPDCDVDEGRGDERGDGENLESVAADQRARKAAAPAAGFTQRFMLRVKLRAEEEANGCEPKSAWFRELRTMLMPIQGERAGQR